MTELNELEAACILWTIRGLTPAQIVRTMIIPRSLVIASLKSAYKKIAATQTGKYVFPPREPTFI